MGRISEIVCVKTVCEKFFIQNFVETGTGAGLSVKHVRNAVPQMPSIHTIECIKALSEESQEKYKNRDINFHIGNSKDVLGEIIPTLEGNTLFWLDAHFPGADYDERISYGAYKDDTIRIPLETELNVICSLRDVSNDVLVMDDLRIYEYGPFERGNWENRNKLGGAGIDFVYSSLGKTHEIQKVYTGEGAVIAWPKKPHTPSKTGSVGGLSWLVGDCKLVDQ